MESIIRFDASCKKGVFIRTTKTVFVSGMAVEERDVIVLFLYENLCRPRCFSNKPASVSNSLHQHSCRVFTVEAFVVLCRRSKLCSPGSGDLYVLFFDILSYAKA